ncbi:hypothetical protein ACLOJK_032565 [Asimina triloba]
MEVAFRLRTFSILVPSAMPLFSDFEPFTKRGIWLMAIFFLCFGTLAEKALLAVLPPEDNFPYTVRVNSEVMASDGSTSMATVCGGSMALMDAGIPVREHVAGVSVGLVSEVDPSTGMIKDYRILTDILGLEDHLGDMDFKIAGTRKGITASQLDIKPAGIPLDIICECLEPALKGRFQILDHMEREINAPRTQDDPTLKYNNDSLRRLIGLQGSLRKKIEQETGARISVSDGTLTIVAKNQSIMEKAQEKVDFLIGREIEVGGIYKGVVTSVKEYGAFVEFNGGQQGFRNPSRLPTDLVLVASNTESCAQVSRVSDVVSVGQQLSLMCIGQDVRGNIKLSLKSTLPESGSGSKTCGVGVSATPKQAPNVWASVEDISDSKDQNSIIDESQIGKNENQTVMAAYSSPSFVIRSAADCDEQDHSANQKVPSKTDGTNQKVPSETDGSNQKVPSKTDGTKRLSPKPKKTLESYHSVPQTHKQEEANNDLLNGLCESGISAKSLRLGDSLTAQVCQIRTHGLVLELGKGIRGMYRFKVGSFVTIDLFIGNLACPNCKCSWWRKMDNKRCLNHGLTRG